MDNAEVDVLSRHTVPRHRLTLDDYHRLGQAGILGEDDRVELLEGQLVDMSPIGPRHALAVDALLFGPLRAKGSAVIILVMASCYIAFRLAEIINKLLGITGNVVLTRLLGIVLAGLAVQFILDGARAVFAG